VFLDEVRNILRVLFVYRYTQGFLNIRIKKTRAAQASAVPV